METTEPKTHLRYKFEVGEEITYETISKRNHGPPRRGREVDLNPGEEKYEVVQVVTKGQDEIEASGTKHKASQPDLVDEPDEKRFVAISVVDNQQQPIPDAVIRLDGLRAVNNLRSHYGQRDSHDVEFITDATGIAHVAYPRYVYERVETGAISFKISHPDYAETRVTSYKIDGGEKPIVMSPGAELIAVALLDGAPVEEFVVYLDSAEYESQIKEGTDGRLLRGIKEGTYPIYFSYTDQTGKKYYSDVEMLELEAGMNHQIELPLYPALSLKGTLNPSVPRPIKNGQVQINMINATREGQDGESDWTAVSVHRKSAADVNADGSFLFSQLPRGYGEIIAICDGFISRIDRSKSRSYFQNQHFNLQSDGQEIVVEMEPTATFSGKVVNAEGQNIGGAKVIFSPNVFWGNFISNIFMEREYSATTDDKGEFSVTNLPGRGGLSYNLQSENYELPITIKWQESRSEVALQILEEMGNCWRTLVLTRSEEVTPPRTSVIEILIHPDGRITFANEQRRQDSIRGITAYLIPRLPDETVKKGLSWKGNVSITGYWNEYSCEVWENVERPGLAKISFLRHNPGKMDEIYKSKSSGNVWFDVSNGRLEKAETSYSQGWGIVSEGNSQTILKQTKKHDRAWIEDKQRETQAYWAAKDEANAAMNVEAQSETEVERQLSVAKAAWQKFLDEYEHGVFVELARNTMESYERNKEYYVENAISRAKILGNPSPDWTLEDFEGKSVTLSSLRGNVVLLDFWYRGCGWCIMSVPQLEQIYEHFKGKPVVMFGMNTDDNKEDALEAIRILDLPYNHLQAQSVKESYGRFGFPTIFIIDKTGIVRSKHTGWSESLAEKVIANVEELCS